jgi:hypothetical protein
MTIAIELLIRSFVSAVAALALLELVAMVVRLVLGISSASKDTEARAEMTGRLLPATQVVAALGGASIAFPDQPALVPALGAILAVVLVTLAVYVSAPLLRSKLLLPVLGFVVGSAIGASLFPVALGLALAFVGVVLLSRSAQLKRQDDARLATVSVSATAAALGVLSMLVLRSDATHLRIDLVALSVLASATLVRMPSTREQSTADRLTVIATTTALSISLVLAPLVADHLTRLVPAEASSTSVDQASQRLLVRPRDPTALIALAWSDTRHGHFDRAERTLRATSGAHEIDVLELEAELLAARGDCPRARAKYDRALRVRTLARFERDVFERQLELGGYAMPTRLVHRCGLGDGDETPTAITPP